MKHITLEIPDNKYSFFLELIKNFDFVKKIEVAKEPTKKEILQGIREAAEEVKLIKAGKCKAVSLKEFLNEV